jgi:hypothetical protein
MALHQSMSPSVMPTTRPDMSCALIGAEANATRSRIARTPQAYAEMRGA